MPIVEVPLPKPAVARALIERWPMFALVSVPLGPQQKRWLQAPVTSRRLRVGMHSWLIAAAAAPALRVLRLGLSGWGSCLIISEEAIGPERIRDAVGRALDDGALRHEVLAAALPSALAVACRAERVTLALTERRGAGAVVPVWLGLRLEPDAKKV